MRSDANECGSERADCCESSDRLVRSFLLDLRITNGERAKAIEVVDARHEFWQQ